MKIKVKLTLGVGLLFLFIILLSVLGTMYINALNKDTQNILVANYNTLDYSRNMLRALDEDITNPHSATKFSANLTKQQMNITEIGEKELTDKLFQDFSILKNKPTDSLLYVSIRKDLTDIMLLNMQAIQRKSDVAKQTATKATWWIGLTGAFCFMIAFVLLINLPGNIANPIKVLTESIKQIAEKNYDKRVHFESHNEFGELAQAFNVMAKKLEEYNSSSLSKIMFQKKRIETLINNLHDPIIGLDEKNMILFANDGALKILGVKTEDLTGKLAQDIAVRNDLMRSLVQELMAKENKHDKNPLKIYADNKESYFEKEIIPISIIPTGEKEQKHIGHFIVLRNITPFKELDFAKTNFIATISHELKTPISAIKASLQLLENKGTGILNEEQKQLTESIKEDSNRLLKITSELLNLSQVETGNIQLNIQPSDPSQILQYALEAVRIPAEQKSITLNVSADENLPPIKADSEKAAWVLINLLTNAIRYSPEKSQVIIKIKNETDNVLFSVKDFGQGIESKYKDKIFMRYFQVPGSSRSGTGLGLAISKEFIEAQGGQISVESELGEGSTFTLMLNKVS
ncbi:MAG: HAMP domain-containing protein [Bacteroidetes bacterium]|nr:HAMP domain-containing protein [Bacteroidota bacterium]